MAWWIVSVCFTSVYLLNLYWYQFLVKGITNILFVKNDDEFKKIKTDKYGVNVNEVDEWWSGIISVPGKFKNQEGKKFEYNIYEILDY